MNATTGRLLAVDWGDKRIGLAVSDALGMLASAGRQVPVQGASRMQ